MCRAHSNMSKTFSEYSALYKFILHSIIQKHKGRYTDKSQQKFKEHSYQTKILSHLTSSHTFIFTLTKLLKVLKITKERHFKKKTFRQQITKTRLEILVRQLFESVSP